MWTLVYKTFEKEFDAIPNGWLVTEESALYPDKSAGTTKRLAREAAPPEVDWSEIEIVIKRRDFESFDRAMADVIRLESGKKTLTASEGELRGRGFRAKKKREDSDSEASSYVTPKKRKVEYAKKKRKHQEPTNIESPLPPFPPLPCPSLQSSNIQSSIPSQKHRKINNPTASTPCTVKKSHICSFVNGPVTLESIAQSSCAISASITVLRNAVQKSHEELLSNIKALQGSSTVIDKNPGVFNIDVGDGDIVADNTIMENFPLTTLHQLQEFEEKLMDKTFKEQTISVILNTAAKSSYSRAITSVLRMAFGTELLHQFTWRGQQRGGQKKQSFSGLKFTSLLIGAMKRKWSIAEEKIEGCISGWLAQSLVKSKKTD